MFSKRNGDKNRETEDWSKKHGYLRMKNRRFKHASQWFSRETYDFTMQHGDLAIKHDDFKSNMAVFHLAKWFFLHGGFLTQKYGDMNGYCNDNDT